MSDKQHDLLGVPKHTNQHRLSRLTMEVHTDELRIIASAVESYTDELIAALEAAEKRITDYHTVLNNLAAVARRYLPDYDEHPDIQAADDLLESAAGIGVNVELQGGKCE